MTLTEIEELAKSILSEDDLDLGDRLPDATLKLCELVRVQSEALQWAKEMFVARDEMNSKVHCAPVRLSPITERVILALDKAILIGIEVE